MPVRPTLPERIALYRLDWGPAPVVDLFAAAGFRAVTFAIDLGLFEALHEGPASAESVAETVGAHPDGIAHLLSFLEPLGYVTRTRDGYAPTSMTRRWLLGDGPNVAPWLTFWQDVVFPYWDEYLETNVREGGPPVTIYKHVDERGGWKATQRGFRAVATLLVNDVFDAVDLPQGDATLLDVGGGHGYYSIEACRRQPDLRATILDTPKALDLAREEIAAAGLDDRIECRGGDALVDDLGGDYDLVFCFNVAHGFEPAENRELFGRLRDSIAPGGRLVVLDQFAGSSRLAVPRLGLAFTAFAYNTALGTTAYESDAIEEWLGDAGFQSVSTTTFRTLPGMGVLEARRM